MKASLVVFGLAIVSCLVDCAPNKSKDLMKKALEKVARTYHTEVGKSSEDKDPDQYVLDDEITSLYDLCSVGDRLKDMLGEHEFKEALRDAEVNVEESIYFQVCPNWGLEDDPETTTQEEFKRLEQLINCYRGNLIDELHVLLYHIGYFSLDEELKGPFPDCRVYMDKK